MALRLPSILLVFGLIGCAIDGDDTGSGTEELSTCNALAGTGCTEGQKCTYRLGASLPDCYPAGTVPDGEGCRFDEATAVDDCQAGLFCAEGGCTNFCWREGDINCAGGQECRADAFQGESNVGVCFETTGLMKPWWP